MKSGDHAIIEFSDRCLMAVNCSKAIDALKEHLETSVLLREVYVRKLINYK